MKAKPITRIQDGINRRFFIALEAIIDLGRVSALESFCKEFDLTPSRYRELRLTFGVTPKPNSLPSRYKYVEQEALYCICANYGVSAEWLLLGRGKMLNNEENR